MLRIQHFSITINNRQDKAREDTGNDINKIFRSDEINGKNGGTFKQCDEIMNIIPLQFTTYESKKYGEGMKDARDESDWRDERDWLYDSKDERFFFQVQQEAH